MQGFKLTFFTQQDRSVHGQSLALWLLEQAKELGIRGATLTAASEGFGHDKNFNQAGRLMPHWIQIRFFSGVQLLNIDGMIGRLIFALFFDLPAYPLGSDAAAGVYCSG